MLDIHKEWQNGRRYSELPLPYFRVCFLNTGDSYPFVKDRGNLGEHAFKETQWLSSVSADSKSCRSISGCPEWEPSHSKTSVSKTTTAPNIKFIPWWLLNYFHTLFDRVGGTLTMVKALHYYLEGAVEIKTVNWN